MDLGKDQSHVNLYQKLDTNPKETYAPDIIGSWSLRNREQLKKTKAEAQKKQMLHWYLGGPKKHKRQRSGKINKRCQKGQQRSEPKSEPLLQEKEILVASAQKKTQNTELEAHPYLTSSPKDAPVEYCSETYQESFICGDISAGHQDTTEQNHFYETGHHLTGPEDLYPKVCHNIALFQEHSSKTCWYMAEPEVVSPKMCEEIMCPQTLSCIISEDTTDRHGCSASPKSFVPEDYCPLKSCQISGGLEEFTFKSNSETAMTEGFFPYLQEIMMSTDVSSKTQRAVEPKYLSHEMYKEITAPTASYTIQETPGSEEHSFEAYQEIFGAEKYSPEAYQKVPGTEDLSTETNKNSDVLNDCHLEESQETGAYQDQEKAVHNRNLMNAQTFKK